MSYAVDTNVLARSVQVNHPMHESARKSVRLLLERGDEVYVLPQNFYEFWVIATRPEEKNGLGLSVSEAQNHLTSFETTLLLVPDIPPIYSRWKNLVNQRAVMGKNAHDARIIAAMDVHGISHLLTFNGSDFKRFDDLITVVEPAELLKTPESNH